MKKDLLALLYRSLDEDLPPSDRKALEEALAASEELRRERERLLAVRAAVSRNTADSFKPFFAERVMRRLAETRQGAKAAQFWQGWVPVFRRVALAGVVAAIALAVANFMQTDGVSVKAAMGLPDVSLEQLTESPVESILEELS